MGGSLARGGEDIWVAVLARVVRISEGVRIFLGDSFSAGDEGIREDIWVAILARGVRISEG